MSDLAVNELFVRTSNVVAADMDGEKVMMDLEKGSYFALTGNGPHLWDKLADPVTISDLVASLEAEFDTAEVTDITALVSDFVAGLVKQGLVVKQGFVPPGG